MEQKLEQKLKQSWNKTKLEQIWNKSKVGTTVGTKVKTKLEQGVSFTVEVRRLILHCTADSRMLVTDRGTTLNADRSEHFIG